MADLKPDHPYTVVVGVSATSKSAAALKWARSQAQGCAGQLIAVRAWRMPMAPASPADAPILEGSTTDDVETRARRTFEEDVEAALGADHGAELRLVRGSKLKALLEAATEADLLVVDAPPQLMTGPMFAHRLIYAATCPVVSMPPSLTTEDGPSLIDRATASISRNLAPLGGSADHPGYRPPPRN